MRVRKGEGGCTWSVVAFENRPSRVQEGSPKSISAPWRNRPPLFTRNVRGIHVRRKVNVSASFLADVSCPSATANIYAVITFRLATHPTTSDQLRRLTRTDSSFLSSRLSTLSPTSATAPIQRGGSSQKSQQQIRGGNNCNDVGQSRPAPFLPGWGARCRLLQRSWP